MSVCDKDPGEFTSTTAAECQSQLLYKKRTAQDSEASFRGVRKRRWGRYVSEIRLPGQKTRIWLGSFGSAEMAARAYDSAAFFLKGDSAILNFPDLVGSLPSPESCTRRDIQSAAAKAALYERRNNEGPKCMGWWEEIGTAAFEEEKAGPLQSPMRLDSMEGELWSFIDHDLDFLTSCF